MIAQLALILLLFAAGWWLRWRGTMTVAHVAGLLRMVVNFAAPPLAFAALVRAPAYGGAFLPPVALALAMVSVFFVAALVAKCWRMERRRAGAFVIAAGSVNMAISLPLIGAIRDDAAIAQWVIMDLGAAVITWTVMAFLAAAYGGHPGEWRRALRRALGMPPFWAIVLAIAVRASGIHVPAAFTALLQVAGRCLMLLVIPAMGASVVALRRLDAQLLAALTLRIGLGTALAALFAYLLGVGMPDRALLLFAGAAPVAFNAMAMSQREALDVPFTAAVTAVSILLAIVYLPLVLMLL